MHLCVHLFTILIETSDRQNSGILIRISISSECHIPLERDDYGSPKCDIIRPLFLPVPGLLFIFSSSIGRLLVVP